jgi:type IV secretion system protein VirB10
VSDDKDEPGAPPPFGTAHSSIEGGIENGYEEQELDSGRPDVAATPGRVLMVLGLAIGFVAFILFSLLSGGDEVDEDQKVTRQVVQSNRPALPPVSPPVNQPIPDLPTLPPAPALEVTPNFNPQSQTRFFDPTDEKRVQRVQSNMLIVNKENSLFGAGQSQQASNLLASQDNNLQFLKNKTDESLEIPFAAAGRVGNGNMRATVAQGKVIDAALETAINTDLPGVIRAVVSRDVYPEAGREKIIPKGSRLIGAYNTVLNAGQTRIYIVWTRLIRPDGIDITLTSGGTDSLGRSGLPGHLDSKFAEIFSASILSSIISIGAAALADEIVGDDTTTTSTSSDGTTTQTASAGATAAADAVGRLGKTSDAIVGRMLNFRPTITVDQGAAIKIIVNKDLIFPTQADSNAQILR